MEGAADVIGIPQPPIATPEARRGAGSEVSEPSAREWLTVFAMSAALVVCARSPFRRVAAFDSDEVGYLQLVKTHWFPPVHTLFVALGRGFGLATGDAYQGFWALGVVTSVLAMVATWWWLRALARPSTALAATLVLAVSPFFWCYGAVASNSYNAIVLVGSFLLGAAWRDASSPRPWRLLASALVLGLGAGYRTDIGLLWAPVFLLMIPRHRPAVVIQAVGLLVAGGLSWFAPSVIEAGGWSARWAPQAQFAHSAGYLNSVWYLGLVDAPLRYATKLGVSLTLSLGPALVLVPVGLSRLRRYPQGAILALLLTASVAPALGLHLLIHFGVPGYAFHYLPAFLALIALGADRLAGTAPAVGTLWSRWRPEFALGLSAAVLAAYFLFYPFDPNRPGWRGDFDLAFARYSRSGLADDPPTRSPSVWRTANSISRRDADASRGASPPPSQPRPIGGVPNPM